MRRCHKLEKFFWTDTRPSGEDALKMKLAHADMAGHVGESGLATDVALDETDGLLDSAVVVILSVHVVVIQPPELPLPPDSCYRADPGKSARSQMTNTGTIPEIKRAGSLGCGLLGHIDPFG